MQKLVLFGCFVLGVSGIAGTFTNTGSASTSCAWDGGAPVPPLYLNATGVNINLTCPDEWVGPPVIGSVGPLMTEAGVGVGNDRSSTFAFQSTFMDSLLPIGGTGQGTVEFTLTYTWDGFGDSGLGTMSGDFSINGSQLWSESDRTCLFGEPCFGPPFNPFIVTTVIDEPITYGVPFSLQADVSSASEAGSGGSYWVQNSLDISPVLITGGQLVELPEPASLWLCGFALLGVLLRLVFLPAAR
jgi:hypothetical protein